MLPVPTVEQLSDFTGRPVNTFPAFATMALTQATLMFQTLTQLTAYPDDPDLARLAQYAIIEMADRIIGEQPYSTIKSSPFQTETIGSYSYSKVTPTTKTVQQGSRAGLFWWDIAVDQLTVLSQSLAAHGSISVIPDGLHRRFDGGWYVENEAEAQGPDRPPYIRIS